ncbi:MAG: cysteine--tRNA ligase [Actinobacteria bacterium]|uniref:Cysteine--tRNA ligase n=1 Tax=freshwater metagenome TaxID=449393 RepID=A0A6J5ZSL8_9ZZZZ|nr:cysteine--tRNA ligase [Actinomycetota bacterium]
MRPIQIYDTRRAELTELEPRDPGKVSIYACGPTVYSRIHVGNARPFVVYSLLKRFLQHEGYDVTFVANITDVNDKIYDAANASEPPKPSALLASEMAALYVADTNQLGLGRPDSEPLATETIGPIIDLIGALIERDAAYAIEGDVYFRVRSDSSYGDLSHRSLDDLDQGEGGEGLSLKEDPLDFALWKTQKAGEDTAWDAPWGRGRPGWHIECSAMAEEILGIGFDIHGGGNDLVFPHHENEAAQTRMARGAELARIWMHNGMLQLSGEKMAKSVGNIEPLASVIEQWGRDALVLFFVSGHYRQPLLFSEQSLEQAQTSARRIRAAALQLSEGPSPAELAEHREQFFEALADDFNTPRALAAMHGWLSAAGALADAGNDDLRQMLTVLGLEALLEAEQGAPEPDEQALALLASREAARSEQDWGRADEIRDELLALGWQVRDGDDGASLVAK